MTSKIEAYENCLCVALPYPIGAVYFYQAAKEVYLYIEHSSLLSLSENYFILRGHYAFRRNTEKS